MLKYILTNIDKYPLDGVIHFELEIDYSFIHEVIDYMEDECKKYGIKFVRIKPRKTWDELGHPFSVISSNPKYNADYLEKIIKTKWLKNLKNRRNSK